MKVTLVTVYDNVDDEWVDKYVKFAGSNPYLRDAKELMEKLVNEGSVTFTDRMNDKGATATTTYKIEGRERAGK